ncbi:MAG TPA: hypothetical protein DIS65_07455, partial [Candidatus Marinimicrobia bacterium]|nr:hypothetical protein [Candidatus Neomarinimicrobiota bacterium]
SLESATASIVSSVGSSTPDSGEVSSSEISLSFSSLIELLPSSANSLVSGSSSSVFPSSPPSAGSSAF